MVLQVGRFHDVWVMTQAENRASIEESQSENPLPGLHFEYISLPSWMRTFLSFQGSHQFYYYLWQIKAYLVARRLNREIGFDLFHHITYGNDWMVSFIGALLPIPYVRGPGGGAHRTPKGLLQEYNFSGRMWEKVRSVGQWLFRHDPLFIKGQQRAHAIMVCNRDSVSIIPKKWSDKVHLFPVSGVTSEDLAVSAPKNENGKEFRVFTAGSLIRIKGFGLAIKAFKVFAEKHPDSRLTIAGGGPEEPRLRKLISDSNLEDRIDLLGPIPRSDVMARMASSDVLLFPSLRDGGGTVVIEAMSAARPVICLNAGGPGLHINESCGIKVEPQSPPETVAGLADALDRLYLDGNLRESMGKAGRERARESYHWDKLGERLMEIYRPIISTKIGA
jgi:glycosyltransferase involved in cell wall biosynthesis